MIGSRTKPKDVVSYMYYKVLFDRNSHAYYITEEQLEDYKKNHVDRIIQNHQDGITTLKHEVELAELISISYYCWFGVQPTARKLCGKSKFPYIIKKNQPVYEDKWLGVAMRLLNSFKIGKGSWYSYIVFAKRDGIRDSKADWERELKYEEFLEEYKERSATSMYLDHDKWHTTIRKSSIS